MAKLPPVQRPLSNAAAPDWPENVVGVRLVREDAAELVNETEIEALLTDLIDLPEELIAAQTQLIDLETELAGLKAVDLPRAKGALDLATNTASMDAYAKGVIDGKNAEQRKLQLDAYLAADEGLAAAQAALAALEGQMASLEAQIARANGDYKAAAARLSATRARAELWSARLRALAALS